MPLVTLAEWARIYEIAQARRLARIPHPSKVRRQSRSKRAYMLRGLLRCIHCGSVLEAVVTRHDDAFQLTTLVSRAGELQVPQLAAAPGATVRAYIRSRDVMLSLQPPQEISALNVLAGKVVQIAQHGAQADVRLDCNGATLVARLTAKSVQRLALAPGRPVFAVIKSVSFERS